MVLRFKVCWLWRSGFTVFRAEVVSRSKLPPWLTQAHCRATLEFRVEGLEILKGRNHAVPYPCSYGSEVWAIATCSVCKGTLGDVFVGVFGCKV